MPRHVPGSSLNCRSRIVSRRVPGGAAEACSNARSPRGAGSCSAGADSPVSANAARSRAHASRAPTKLRQAPIEASSGASPRAITIEAAMITPAVDCWRTTSQAPTPRIAICRNRRSDTRDGGVAAGTVAGSRLQADA